MRELQGWSQLPWGALVVESDIFKNLGSHASSNGTLSGNLASLRIRIMSLYMAFQHAKNQTMTLFSGVSLCHAWARGNRCVCRRCRCQISRSRHLYAQRIGRYLWKTGFCTLRIAEHGSQMLQIVHIGFSMPVVNWLHPLCSMCFLLMRTTQVSRKRSSVDYVTLRPYCTAIALQLYMYVHAACRVCGLESSSYAQL